MPPTNNFLSFYTITQHHIITHAHDKPPYTPVFFFFFMLARTKRIQYNTIQYIQIQITLVRMRMFSQGLKPTLPLHTHAYVRACVCVYMCRMVYIMMGHHAACNFTVWRHACGVRARVRKKKRFWWFVPLGSVYRLGLAAHLSLSLAVHPKKNCLFAISYILLFSVW
jgi:hypothetical protein